MLPSMKHLNEVFLNHMPSHPTCNTVNRGSCLSTPWNRCKRCRFNSWVRKISWSRKWQSTPVFLPGKFQGQWSLVNNSPWGCIELDMTEWLRNTSAPLHLLFGILSKRKLPSPALLPPKGSSNGKGGINAIFSPLFTSLRIIIWFLESFKRDNGAMYTCTHLHLQLLLLVTPCVSMYTYLVIISKFQI